MERCRILFVLPNNDIGGNTKFILNLAKSLDDELFECEFYVPWLTHFEYTKLYRARKNLFIWIRYLLGQIRAELFERRLSWMGARLGIGKPKVQRYLANPSPRFLQNADVLVFTANYQMYRARDLGVDIRKMVLVIHHSGYNKDRSLVEPQILNPNFRISVSSRFTANECRDIGIKDFVEIPLGVDLQMFNEINEYRVNLGLIRIGFFYYNNNRKNPKMICEIVNYILRKYANVEIHVFGNNFPLRDKKIVTHSRLAEESYSNALAVLDLFVYVSKLEGFALPPLEAMACGVPILANRVGAVPEYLQDNKGGFIIENDSGLEVWCEKIDFLIENPQLLQSLRLQARVSASNWSWEKTAQKYKTLFFEVLNKAQARSSQP